MSSTQERSNGEMPAAATEALKNALRDHLVHVAGKDRSTATPRDWFGAVAAMVRDRLIERWVATMDSYYRDDAKRIYYLSLEFLMGRCLDNALHNLLAHDEYRAALAAAGLDLEQLASVEDDAALGNGGLGRLAACFLDSMATLGLPGYGYGIRYDYGMFTQRIEHNRQVEHPDNWLRYGNPWEFARPEVLYPVRFGGHVVTFQRPDGRQQFSWEPAELVMAMAYDMPIPGYGTDTVNNLRLWSAKASRDFDLEFFNEGNYIRAVEEKNASENLSRVLYPDDTTEMGRELRLRQQYFFVSASLQDILGRYAKHSSDWSRLGEKVAIQLNDTHPAIAIPELLRVLLDEQDLPWDEAMRIVRSVFAYTCHTLLPEALESWPVALFEQLLPRHLQLVYEINARMLREVAHACPGDNDLLRRMSIIDEAGGRRVRMSHLAIAGSHRVNGVAALHTQLMQETIFADFSRLWPDRFVNVTNGVTPRRWLNHANRGLAELVDRSIGRDWVTDLEQLRKLEPLAEDPAFQDAFRAIKRSNKARLAGRIQRELGIEVSPDALFDVQIKRIHEYKRQLLNLLHVVARYNRIREEPGSIDVPRVVLFSGKAAPGYDMAKRIIHLINEVADTINNDPAVHDLLKVVFLPNYGVTSAEAIIPAADLSEQISTAGTEASGTGNMKLALNGALTIGTLDGANIEIMEEVGEDEIFIFGLTAAEVERKRAEGYRPRDHYDGDEVLRRALDMIASGHFSHEAPHEFRPVVDALLNGDRFLVLADFAAYLACQDRVDALYRDPRAWDRKAILNVARMGRFSSDRTIADYARQIWNVEPMR